MSEEGVLSDESLKLAVAISLIRSKVQAHSHHNRTQAEPSNSTQPDDLRWKRKAKERKREILRLREDLKEAQDAWQCDLFPKSASCKCYFFNNLGKLNPRPLGDGFDTRFNDVLRRRFLRQVRFKERRRSTQVHSYSGLTWGETDQLRAAVDFLVEICDSFTPAYNTNFENLAHQAVDFILASLKILLSARKNLEIIASIVNSLVVCLVRKMCAPSQANGKQFPESHQIDKKARLYIQHLIRKLGSEPYIGQRAMLLVSERISVLSERLLFSNPFEESFLDMHECMFMMIQFIEFLVSDYLLEWSKVDDFDCVLLEKWVTSIVHARKALELLESRNGLYVLFMHRVTGELAKLVCQIPPLQKLTQDLIDSLFN